LDKTLRLKDLRIDLDRRGRTLLPFCLFEPNALRRTEEEMIVAGHRQNFSLDGESNPSFPCLLTIHR